MSKILLATEKPFAADAVQKIKNVVAESQHTLELLESYTDQQQLKDAIADADALIIRSDKVDRSVLESGQQLKIVVRAGAGYDNVDLQAASEQQVVVMNTPGQNANAVAELVIGFMIFQSRKQFNGSSGTEIRGKKLGIVGYGNIGRLVAQAGKLLGMDVLAYDKFVEASVMQEKGIHPAGSIEDIFSSCQYVSLHIPVVSASKGAVDYHLLSSMPFNAMLINTARQEVVNEKDLLQVMQERKDLSFVSDFMPKEPGFTDTSLTGRWFAPPKKMGAQTAEANVNAGIAAARQIIRFFDSGDTTFRVN